MEYAAIIRRHHRTGDKYILIRPDITLRGDILADHEYSVRVAHDGPGVLEIIIDHIAAADADGGGTGEQPGPASRG